VRIKRGDEVLVIAGKDKGKRGVVRRSIPSENRVVVEGVNIVKKHQRGRPGVQQAGIIEMESPIHVSNVMAVCPHCGAPTRVAIKRDEKGHKTRYCRRCNESIERS